MNIIDIRTGQAPSIEGVVFADDDCYNVVAISFDDGDIGFHNQDDLDCDSNTAYIRATDVPAFYASLRKGIELGLLPPFEPVPAPPKAPVARKATAAKKA